MTIYSGTVEYSGSASHPAGQTRELSAGSNNPLIIQAFGLDVFPPSGATAQGKISLTDLESGHVVRVDPQDMTGKSDTDYLKSHAGSITDMRAAGEYLWVNNRSELEALANRINPISGAHYTNDVIDSLAVAYLTGDDSQARELLADTEGQSKTQESKDALVRAVNSVHETFTTQYGGLDVVIVVAASIAESSFEGYGEYLNFAVDYTVESARVIGSKASIAKVDNKKQQLAAFNAVKRGAQELVGFTQQDQRGAVVSNSELISNVRKEVQTQIDLVFKNTVTTKLEENANKYIDDVDELPDINVASVYAKLWNELKLSGAEIPRNGIDQSDLTMYSIGALSAQTLLLKYEELFTSKFKTALVKKFTQYVDEEAYAERALDQASPDLGIKTAEQREEWRPIALKEAENAVDTYVEKLQAISSFSEASETYYLPIAEHSRRIIDAIFTALLAKRDELLQDAGANNPATRQAFEAKLETALLNKRAEMLADISPQLAGQLGDAELEVITNSAKQNGLAAATGAQVIGTEAEADVIANVVKDYGEQIKRFIRRVTSRIVPLLKDQLVESTAFLLKQETDAVSDEQHAKIVELVDAEVSRRDRIGFMDHYYNNVDAVTQFFADHEDELLPDPNGDGVAISLDEFTDLFDQEASRIKAEVVTTCEDILSRSGLFEPSFSAEAESTVREKTDRFLDNIQNSMVNAFNEQRGKLASVFQEAVDNKTVVTDNDLVALASRTAESCIDREYYVNYSNRMIDSIKVPAWVTQQYEYSVLFQEQLNAQYQVPSNVNVDNWINNYANLPEALGQRMVSSSEVSSMLDATIEKFVEQLKESADDSELPNDDELNEDFDFQLEGLADEGAPFQAQIKADVNPYRQAVIDLAKEKIQAGATLAEVEDAVGDALERVMFEGGLDYDNTTSAIYDQFISDLDDAAGDDDTGLLSYVNGDNVFWKWEEDATPEDLFSFGRKLNDYPDMYDLLDKMDSSWQEDAESRRDARDEDY